MIEHPYGWLSLTPPLAAIVLAIATKRVIPSLLAGVFVGALVTSDGNPLVAIPLTLETHLWKTLIDPGKLRVFSFTLLMGATVGVISRSGGMQGLVELVSPWAKTRRRGQLTTWLLGLIIFFDDYANTILLGNTLRPLCDRLKISREKLAYLVDSTAAPVAGLALVSTWVAVEIEYVAEGLSNLDTELGLQAFPLFVASIPYRFYVLMALVFVPLVALMQRDFGPMLSAERKRIRRDNVIDYPARLASPYPTEPEPSTPARWYNAVLPIGLTVAVVVWLMVTTGANAVAAESGSRPALRDILGAADFSSAVQLLGNVLGAADSSLALQYGALAGLGLASLLALSQRLLTRSQVVAAAGTGARLVLPAIAILWLASTVSRMTGNTSADGAETTVAYEHQDHRLYTGDYLQSLLGDNESKIVDQSGIVAPAPRRHLVWLFPTIVFIVAAVVAFCTGTSWGTMGILMPSTVTLVHSLLAAEGVTAFANDPILLSSIGGVLSGAIFGDHCSPISDTTVLSSQSSGCDHIAHVWTQLPYALAVAVISVGLGTLPLGLGISVWILLPLQVVSLIVLLLVVGRRAEA